jgi:3-dehydroquinate synthase
VSRTVRVALGGRAYDVVIGPGLIEGAGGRIAPLLRRPFAPVVMDQTVASLHGERLRASLARTGVACPQVVILPGEAAKSFAGLSDLCDRLLELGVERTDTIIAFGGGVVGDLAGFAAAILMRGMDFVQIPTTLLAQVDSSVGGKTAIDTPRGKNLIGAFHQPRLVLADLEVLATLPQRELACGYAEILKYGLLGDRDFFEWLEADGAGVLRLCDAPLARAVGRSVEMKAEVVAKDEREGGARALLNLGHTFGHAVEALTGFGEAVKHGEAVGLGCALAFRFSAAQGLCPPAEATRATGVIAQASLPTRLCDVFPAPPSAEALITAMTQDKKAQGGALTLVLVRGLGEAFVARGVDPVALRNFLSAEGAAP